MKTTDLSARLKATIEFSDPSLRKDGRFRNAAVGAGALAAGAGVAYAGHRIGKAADQVSKVARNANAITGGVVRTGNKIVRASRFIKRQLAKIPGMRFDRRLVATIEFAEKKREWNPALKAGLSAAASGAVFGLLPALNRGTKLATVAKSVAAGAGAGAALGGGGTVIGTRILGKQKRGEGAPITKRAAVGGAIGGALLGGAGTLVLRKVGRKLPGVGSPARALIRSSRTNRAALLIRKAPLPAAIAAGTGIGAIAGAAHASDEGQQVDTLNNLKKDKRKMFSARLQRTIEFAQDEAGIPFSGKVAKDRYIKKIRDEDLDRRDANLLRAGVTGAAVGLLTRGKLSALKRAAIGAGAGGAAVVGVRKITAGARDPYGERSRGAKRAESLPAVAGIGAAGLLAARKLKPLIARRFSATVAVIELGRRDQPRFVDSKQYADPLRAYGDSAGLVDAAGNPTRLTQTQLVNAAWRGGHQVRKTVRRSGNLLRDVSDVANGRSNTSGRKREWEKEWFRNSLLSAGGAGALLAHAVARRKLPGYRMQTDAVERIVKAKVGKVRAKVDETLGLSRQDEVFFSRLEATVRLIELDAFSEMAGWDVRDPRGRSARVFAPGSRKRVRRPADWHETKDGQRKILGGLAVAGTIAGLAGGLVAGRKLGSRPRRGAIWAGYSKGKVLPFPDQAAS